MLILGDSGSTGDYSAVRGDDGQPTTPMPMPAQTPPQGESPIVPDSSMLDQLYDDSASECQWTAGYVAFDTPLNLTEESGAPKTLPEISVAFAVALGGFWMKVAERSARRKRPELAT
jgi:hypothetical protein